MPLTVESAIARGDLSRRKAQPPQRQDRLHPRLLGAIRDSPGSRGAIAEPRLAFCAITVEPFARAAHADTRSPSCGRERLPLEHDAPSQPPPTTPAERRVTVKLHPGSPSN